MEDLVSENKMTVVKNLLSKQTMKGGTSSTCISILILVTRSRPEIWKLLESESNPNDKLQTLVSLGSYNGPPAFWNNINTLFRLVPFELPSVDLEQSQGFLRAI